MKAAKLTTPAASARRLTLSKIYLLCLEGTVRVASGNWNTAARLINSPPDKARTLKPKRKLNVFFDVTFNPDCLPDRDEGFGHEDFACTTLRLMETRTRPLPMPLVRARPCRAVSM